MANNKNQSRFVRMRKNIAKFFKELRAELKKVVWPTGKQLKNNTITVLLTCLLIGGIIWIADFLMRHLVQLTLLK